MNFKLGTTTQNLRQRLQNCYLKVRVTITIITIIRLCLGDSLLAINYMRTYGGVYGASIWRKAN